MIPADGCFVMTQLTKELFVELLEQAMSLSAVIPEVTELLDVAAASRGPAPLNKRRAHRIGVSYAVTVQSISEPFAPNPPAIEAILLDVSVADLGLRSPVPFGGRFALDLPGDDGRNVLVHCYVTTCTRADDAVYRIGAKFDRAKGIVSSPPPGNRAVA